MILPSCFGKSSKKYSHRTARENRKGGRVIEERVGDRIGREDSGEGRRGVGGEVVGERRVDLELLNKW